MRFSLLLIPLLLAGCASMGGSAPRAGLFTQAYGAKPSVAETVYVVIHGDGVRTTVDVGDFARKLAAAEPDSAVVRLLRPGFSDEAGNTSPGTRAPSPSQDYTAVQVNAVADTIAALRTRYRKVRIVTIGEAGGAIITANIAGLRPGVIDGMVLVSCACALPEWRRYIATREPDDPRWKGKMDSLDPLQTAGGISPGLRAAILIGGADTRVPARFSRSYAEALSLRGIATDYRIIPGRTAPVLDDPQVIEAARRLAAALPRKTR